MRKAARKGMPAPMGPRAPAQGVLGQAAGVVQRQQAPSGGLFRGNAQMGRPAQSAKGQAMRAPAREPQQENSIGYADGGLIESRMKARPGQVTRDYGKKAKK